MSGLRRSVVLAAASTFALMLSGCGDENSTAPPSVEFPRAFTSLSETCTQGFVQGTGTLNGELVFVEETKSFTVEASAEVLFAGTATILLRKLFDLVSLQLVAEEGFGDYEPSAVDGTWHVTLTPGPRVGSLTATGDGFGELSGRSIDFDLEPLSDGCGYTSSGTIR